MSTPRAAARARRRRRIRLNHARNSHVNMGHQDVWASHPAQYGKGSRRWCVHARSLVRARDDGDGMMERWNDVAWRARSIAGRAFGGRVVDAGCDGARLGWGLTQRYARRAFRAREGAGARWARGRRAADGCALGLCLGFAGRGRASLARRRTAAMLRWRART